MTKSDKALVEELREDGYKGHNPLCLKAADRIGDLEAVLRDILPALRDYQEVALDNGHPEFVGHATIALHLVEKVLGETK